MESPIRRQGRKATSRRGAGTGSFFEFLEGRCMLSAADPTLSRAAGVSTAATGAASVSGYTPAQISVAYGFDQIKFKGNTVAGDGSGQTIAVVDAYNDSSIVSDLHVFDAQFGLADPPAMALLNQTGGTGLPRTDAGWSQEMALDVEWAHAMAPAAKIVVVEANSDSTADLVAAAATAARVPGVSVVSMSWGGSEFSGEAGYASSFLSPAGKRPVTFVAASGDEGGRGGPEWPASSASVLAVGGTTLTTAADGTYVSESAWRDSTGGASTYVNEPAYQNGVQSTGARTTPDVSLNANPSTGFAIYDSVTYEGVTGWQEIGGTSAGTPIWAALVAIGNQGRNLNGLRTIDGTSGTLPLLYSLYQNYSNFYHDVTGFSGGRFGPSATTGYDELTGLGTPRARQVAKAIANAETVIAALAAETVAAAVTAASPALSPAAVAASPEVFTGPSSAAAAVAPQTRNAQPDASSFASELATGPQGYHGDLRATPAGASAAAFDGGGSARSDGAAASRSPYADADAAGARGRRVNNASVVFVTPRRPLSPAAATAAWAPAATFESDDRGAAATPPETDSPAQAARAQEPPAGLAAMPAPPAAVLVGAAAVVVGVWTAGVRAAASRRGSSPASPFATVPLDADPV